MPPAGYPDCGTIPSTRFQFAGNGYGRLVAYNASTLVFTAVRNNDSAIVDEWAITQANHGPFPAAHPSTTTRKGGTAGRHQG